MENNNNGRGIFYGVIGVATLVVAIIGATFAYFSATAVSNNAVNVGTTTVSLSFTDEYRQAETDLIPVVSSHTNFKKFPGKRTSNEASVKGEGTCRDLDGNAICSLYEFTVYNPAAIAQTVYGSIMVTDKSTELVNMSYALFKGSIEENTGNFDVDTTAQFATAGTNVAVSSIATDGGLIIAGKKFGEVDVKDDWADYTEMTLAAGASQTFTVLVWLEEFGEGNVNEAGGKSLTAEVTFDTGSGSGVTGRLDVAA